MIKGQQVTGATLAWIAAFIVWPFVTFVASFKTIGSRSFGVVFVLFYFLYGYTYVIAGEDQDTFRTAGYFLESANWSVSDLWLKLTNLYKIGAKPDIFQDILQFVLSRFTTDVRIYFASTAVVFAYFASRIFSVICIDSTYEKRQNAVLLLLFLFLVLSPGRINSFRHYLATALFILGAYQYLTVGGIKYIVLVLSTTLVHFAFVMVVPLAIIYKVVGNRLWIYYTLIVFSFIFSPQVADVAREYTRNLDESALQYQAKVYTDENYLEQVSELQSQRYFILDRYIYFTTLFFLALTIYHSRYLNRMDLPAIRLYALSLLIFAFVNLFADLESVSNRFGVLYQGFCCVFLIRANQKSTVKSSWFIKNAILVFLLVNSVIAIRVLVQSASVSTLLVFFPVSIIFPVDLSIFDWIK